MDKIGTSTNIKRTISKEDFHIKKKFGQNFLTDQNILRNITNIAEIDNVEYKNRRAEALKKSNSILLHATYR
mgnify:CR=1 FL=1